MANLVKKEEFLPAQKQILLADELAFTLGAIIKNTGVEANAQGKKIVKAGTPVTGNILKRQAGFEKGTAENATAVLLHDVDVTAGNENGTIVIFGFIDLDKLDADVQEMYDATMVSKLNKITVVRGNDQINQ